MEDDDAFLIGLVLIDGDGLRVLYETLRDGNQQLFHTYTSLSGRRLPGALPPP